MSNETNPIVSKQPKVMPLELPKLQVGDFYLKNGFLYQKTEDGPKKICRAIWIKETKYNTDTNEIDVVVCFVYRGRIEQRQVPRDILMDNKIQTLTKYGADIPKYAIPHIVNFLTFTEEKSKESQEHIRLGWNGERDGYYHNAYIALDTQYQSTYKGDFKLVSDGTKQSFLSAVEKHISGRTPLEFMLACGFSAVVNGYISKYVKQDTLIVHLAGESSTGKTTAAVTAIAPFGKPDTDGLIKTWNSTMNALLKEFADNHGVPLVLDESSSKEGESFTTVLYQLAEGKERSRLTKEAEKRQVATWNTTVIATGEHKLTEKSAKNNGLVVRVLEFEGVKWTESAEHSKQIKEVFSTHYGTLFEEYVRHILQHYTPEALYQKLEQAAKLMHDNFKFQDKFSERISMKYGVILLAAQLFNDCFTLQLNTEEMIEFMAKNDLRQVGKRTMDQKALSVIEQFILKNRHHFEVTGTTVNYTDFYGKVTYKKDHTEVIIIKKVLDDELKKCGFASTEVVMSELKNNNYLNAEAGKNTRKRTVPASEDKKVQQNVYVLQLSKTFKLDLTESLPLKQETAEETLETQSLPKQSRKPLRKTSGSPLTSSLSEQSDEEVPTRLKSKKLLQKAGKPIFPKKPDVENEEPTEETQSMTKRLRKPLRKTNGSPATSSLSVQNDEEVPSQLKPRKLLQKAGKPILPKRVDTETVEEEKTTKALPKKLSKRLKSVSTLPTSHDLDEEL